MESLHTELLTWPVETWAALVIAGFATAVALALIGLSLQRRHLSADLIQYLGDSTSSRLLIERQSTGGDFQLRFAPAPEPFTALQVVRQRKLAGWYFLETGRPPRRRRDCLQIEGTLHEPPAQELLWVSGQLPGRALQHGAGHRLWTLRRLDLTQSEYVIRGDGVAALEHLLFELQRRYAPRLRQFTVSSERAPHVVIALEITHGLNAEEMLPLINIVRGAGRAAALKRSVRRV